jgi:hypothetical protein
MNGILSLYEPTIEVTKRDMEQILSLFKDVGFIREVEWSHILTRFMRLRKVSCSG